MKESKNHILKMVRSARSKSVPILGITTPDPAATIQLLNIAVPDRNEQGEDQPRIMWDIVEGLRPLNEAGQTAKARVVGEVDTTVGNLLQCLIVAKQLPKLSLLVIHMSNRFTGPAETQAIWNLRDKFKSNERTLVLLAASSLELPPEISGDVIVIDEPLPDAEQLAAVVREQHQSAGLEVDAETIDRAVEAVQGLALFQAEQIVAMSLRTKGISLPDLWERKRRQIELTPGLKVNRENVQFDDIGGVPVIKDFLRRIVNGNARPNAVVLLEEIEKMMAGAAHDTSGVSQDQLGTILTYMQDTNAVGCILVGPPGTSKSQLAKATGTEAGIVSVALDLGGMKQSLVGASEGAMRAALKVITSVSNGRSLWIATSNSIAEMPPELRRRFTLGTFFLDVPIFEERKAIWKIWLGKYNLKAKADELPDDEGWTGAEIKQACDIAWRLGVSLLDASKFVVPVSRSAAEQIDRLRKAAEGRFLSASKPGVYQRPGNDLPDSRTPNKRKLSLED